MSAPNGYTVFLGGAGGVASRITGSIPRKLSADDVARLRHALATGRSIEIRTASRESWLAMAPSLFSQIGLAP